MVSFVQVYNKIDQTSIEEVNRIAHQPDCVVISCEMKLNLDYFLEQVWEYLNLICVYTKKRSRECPIYSICTCQILHSLDCSSVKKHNALKSSTGCHILNTV